MCRGRSEAWADVPDRHYGNTGTWHIERCCDCRALFLDPMPSEEELGSFYPAEYYADQPAAPPRRSTGWRQRLRSVVLPIGTKEPAFERAGSMLDVGCGTGWMLDRYAQMGWTAEGVEYSESACEVGRAAGRTIHSGSLIQAKFADEQFDYVRSNHSFEHLWNPHETLEEMSRILRPGGTVFIGVPDSAGLAARVFGREWYYVGAPAHVINYDRRNLARLMAEHGFRVVETRGNSNHGGTVGSLQSWFISRRGHGSLESGPVTSPPLILIGYWTSRLLDLFRLGDCVEITAVKTDGETSEM